MPRNFKEAMMFTALMCTMMVFGMSCWNLIINGAFSWSHVFLGFLPGFAVAFILDTVVVGPLAKKIAFSFIPSGLKNHRIKIFAISACMVLGMVSCMSLYGLLFNGVTLTVGSYLTAWILNFVVALPYNFLVVGPVARFLLAKVQKPHPVVVDRKVEAAEEA